MTFGPLHYVPSLKMKRGEKAALQALGSTHSTTITPLLEIVERTEKPLDAHLATSFKGLRESVGAYSRCFLDADSILASDGFEGAKAVFSQAAANGITHTPVVRLSSDLTAMGVVTDTAVELALRVTRRDLESGGLSKAVSGYMSNNRLDLGSTDLVVDLGAVGELVVQGVEALQALFFKEIPNLDEWKTVTVSACAFPRSMSVVGRHASALVSRVDWLAWRDRIHAGKAGLSRTPTFGDGAIQHPSGVEGFDPKTMQVSAAIRYTQPQDWLLIKGESTRVTRPGIQFTDLAKRLVTGDLAKYFLGSTHCVGCGFIHGAAAGAAGLGSAEAWRRIGTIHHIATVTESLRTLPAP